MANEIKSKGFKAMKKYRTHEIVLVGALILIFGFFLATAIARPVGAEDDCLEGVWSVDRIAGKVWCIGEFS
jgi:hypothetical protein